MLKNWEMFTSIFVHRVFPHVILYIRLIWPVLSAGIFQSHTVREVVFWNLSWRTNLYLLRREGERGREREMEIVNVMYTFILSDFETWYSPKENLDKSHEKTFFCPYEWFQSKTRGRISTHYYILCDLVQAQFNAISKWGTNSDLCR